MKNTILVLAALLLVVGGYVYSKDRQIKKELETVERSEFTENTGIQNENSVDSEITATRTGGQWSVSQTGEYTLDQDSLKLEFIGYKPGGQHVGTFNDGVVRVSLDEDGQPVRASIVFEVASVETDTLAVDKHLQEEVFFDAMNNPQIALDIQGIEVVSDSSVRAITTISMAGQTRTLAIPVTLTQVADGMRFDVDTLIKISEYGMAFGPVQDDVRIMASGILKRN